MKRKKTLLSQQLALNTKNNDLFSFCCKTPQFLHFSDDAELQSCYLWDISPSSVGFGRESAGGSHPEHTNVQLISSFSPARFHSVTCSRPASLPEPLRPSKSQSESTGPSLFIQRTHTSLYSLGLNHKFTHTHTHRFLLCKPLPVKERLNLKPKEFNKTASLLSCSCNILMKVDDDCFLISDQLELNINKGEMRSRAFIDQSIMDRCCSITVCFTGQLKQQTHLMPEAHESQ